MITPAELDRLSKLEKINKTVIFREYLQLLFLETLYSSSGAEKIYFKGGTALRVLWNSFRFSEDLDFTVGMSEISFSKFIDKVFEDFLINDGVSIKKKKTIVGKSFLITYFGDVLPFKVFVSLDFSFRERPKYTARTAIKTDFPVVFTSFIYHLDKREVLAEKIRALLTRSKGRDLFDIWFLVTSGVEIDWRLVGSKMDYYPKVKWGKGTIVEAVNKFSRTDFVNDLKPFLPLNQRAKVGSIYDVAKALLNEEIK